MHTLSAGSTFPVYRGIEYHTRLWLVTNDKEHTPEEYGGMKPENDGLFHIEPDYSELEYRLQVYPSPDEGIHL